MTTLDDAEMIVLVIVAFIIGPLVMMELEAMALLLLVGDWAAWDLFIACGLSNSLFFFSALSWLILITGAALE